ncbi:unnamed protein product [Caenorhabditis brenneri]
MNTVSRNASINSVDQTPHDIVSKYTDKPHKFAVYEQLVATPPSMQSRRASSICNRVVVILIILASLFLLCNIFSSSTSEDSEDSSEPSWIIGWATMKPIFKVMGLIVKHDDGPPKDRLPSARPTVMTYKEPEEDYKNSQKFTQVDRACIQDEWEENDSLDNSSTTTDTYRISFSDTQKSFKWLHTPPQIQETPEILMIVSSNCDNFARRNIIRKTLMSTEKNQIVGDGRMKFLFLTGVSAGNEKLNAVVLEEAKVFGDMIVVDVEDTYLNLPYKSISLLLYGAYKTPESVKLIGKIDEDVIFYPDQLTPLINKGTINMSSFAVYGEKWQPGVSVNHGEDGSKWAVSKTSYKCNVYPSYLSGPFYLTTRKAAERIVPATKHRKFISVEDVFITGLLAGDVGVEKVQIPNLFMVHDGTIDSEKFDITAWHTGKNNEQFQESWEKLRLSRCKACSRKAAKNFRGSRSQYGEENGK